ncbi:hypothetical protein M0D69_30305 [Caballeronia sp. SEWSISQ10-4 2]|uniref:hypothetical protein n=1 Tax=Caballeronia sp. SEWSISQ10-4 2 TaxID=2937438 RepID=UPI00264A717B|nr:hypothetical protein [Caballeronia sp. SEWSISQ10-4 2]MDN7182234.1 hypothetical protein [Caballeronia sp. SEWSISQ10-4 2]
MPTSEQTKDTLYATRCRIDNIASADAELQAETCAAEVKGYISAVREHQLIEHADFKVLWSGVEKALSDWHRNRPKCEG